MNKTDETYVPLSRGIVEHLKILKGMPFTIYAYLLSEADFCGKDKGVAKKKIRDIASDLELDYKTVHSSITKLKGKYIEVKPAKNQHSITRFKILKYKTVDDFIKSEQHPNSTQASTQAIGEATPVATEKHGGKQGESTPYEPAIDGDLQIPKKLRSKEGEKLKKTLKTIDLPSWVDKEIWQAFLDMRKKIKKPATLKAQELIIKEIIKLGKHNANKILERSIMNSYQGVFPLKEQTKSQEQSNHGASQQANRPKAGPARCHR